MRASRSVLASSAAALGILVLVASCGSPGSSDGSSPSTSSSSTAAEGALTRCEAIADESFVGLVDDKNLQNPDNVVPAVNSAAAAADPGIITVLDTVSAVLDTPALVDLNKAVEVDRKTTAQAAEAFVAAHDLGTQEQVGNGVKVVVGSPNFNEGATLANLYVQVLKAAGYDASTQDIGNRELYLTDLESGAITVVPEYVSTLTEFLNVKANGDGAAPIASSDLGKTVEGLTTIGATVGLSFGTPAAAQDQNSYAVTKAFSDKYKVTTLSELAANCGDIVLGGPPECPERTFCGLGLQDVYGLEIGEFVSLDAGGNLTKQALKTGKINVGMILSSDPSLATS